MYDLFKGSPSHKTSGYVFPELLYVRRTYVRLIDDVKSYYRRYPKYVDPKNILGNILLHIPLKPELDDTAYAGYVEDTSDSLIKAFGLVASNSRGGSFRKGMTLGKNTSEVIIAHSESFDVNNLRQSWRELTPFHYLYHSRTDLNLPIMNNQTPGKGYGVAALNLPMLAVQYRYWLRFNLDKDTPQKEAVHRFIGSYVLPNAINSFLDIAFFNRLARGAQGIGSPTYPTPHPFYLTDMTPRVERLITTVNAASVQRVKDIEQLAWATPVLSGENLYQTAYIPKDPVTRQNEWAIVLARLPYIRYLVGQAVAAGRTDRSALNKVRVALLEAKWDRTISTIGDPWLTDIYKQQTEHVFELLR